MRRTGKISKATSRKMEEARWNDVMTTGRVPPPMNAIEQQELEKILNGFQTPGAGDQKPQWARVPLNETWSMMISTPMFNAQNIVDTIVQEREVSDDSIDEFYRGDRLWPSSVVLARWLAIHPKPPAPLRGKVVLELGAGLGLPSLTAARLGADSVLLQDKDGAALQEAMVSVVEGNQSSVVSALRSTWDELPERLLSAPEESLRRFAGADVLLGSEVLYDERAAEGVAGVLAKLLQTQEQRAYITDACKQRHRGLFIRLCEEAGLSVSDVDVSCWEPEEDTINEHAAMNDVFCRLLTVSRP
ncbi:unnamed protein product [Prorocentrum cordatum]|uniref:Calmodulin-lysine N-methyltransferase n=1 Tax=Prorocentrum cordatum TaxID=2364126 RepID=A0ABN9U744_9DINO|nr:unnamed protein product [Polarella glacialis]